MNSNKGFTLIELVIVIIVIGILSATAIPKFLDIHTDAKISTLKGVEAGFRSATSIVMAKAELEGLASSNEVQTIGDTGIKVQYGNLYLTTENINKAMELSGISVTDGGEGDPGKIVVFHFGDQETTTNFLNSCHFTASINIESGKFVDFEYSHNYEC